MSFCIKKHMSQERWIFLKVKQPPSTQCTFKQMGFLTHLVLPSNGFWCSTFRQINVFPKNFNVNWFDEKNVDFKKYFLVVRVNLSFFHTNVMLTIYLWKHFVKSNYIFHALSIYMMENTSNSKSISRNSLQVRVISLLKLWKMQ